MTRRHLIRAGEVTPRDIGHQITLHTNDVTGVLRGLRAGADIDDGGGFRGVSLKVGRVWFKGLSLETPVEVAR